MLTDYFFVQSFFSCANKALQKYCQPLEREKAEYIGWWKLLLLFKSYPVCFVLGRGQHVDTLSRTCVVTVCPS